MEVINELIGESSSYLYFVFAFVLLTGFVAPMHIFMTQFLAPPIKHWCSKPASLQNISAGMWMNISGQTASFLKNDKSCEIYDLDYENLSRTSEFSDLNSSYPTKKCNGTDFDNNLGSTITEKWDLVCDEDLWLTISTSIYFAGMMTGVLLMGQISDRVGRKQTLLACLVLWFCSSIGAIVSEFFSLFVVMRFLVGLFNEGGFVAEWVLFMEVCDSKQRAILGNLASLGFSLGFAGLACVAYFVHSWQFIILITSLPIILLFIYACYLLESPLWLISQGQFDAAKEVILRIAKFNKIHLTDDSYEVDDLFRKLQREKKEEEKTSANVKDLFILPNIRRRTLIIYFVWLVDALVYYGLTLNIGNLDGNMYINFAVSGIVEFPAYLLCIVVFLKFGRRVPLAILFIVGGLALLLTLLVPEGVKWPIWILSMIGKFAIAATFQMTYVYTSELFPTVVRNVGLGSSSMFAKFGSVISPFINKVTNSHGKYITPVLFGTLSVAAGLFVLLLPETKDAKLPQTIEDGENFDMNLTKEVVDPSSNNPATSTIL